MGSASSTDSSYSWCKSAWGWFRPWVLSLICRSPYHSLMYLHTEVTLMNINHYVCCTVFLYRKVWNLLIAHLLHIPIWALRALEFGTPLLWPKGSSLCVRTISYFISLLIFNVTTSPFKITYVAHVVFLLDGAALGPWILQQWPASLLMHPALRSHSEETSPCQTLRASGWVFSLPYNISGVPTLVAYLFVRRTQTPEIQACLLEFSTWEISPPSPHLAAIVFSLSDIHIKQ